MSLDHADIAAVAECQASQNQGHTGMGKLNAKSRLVFGEIVGEERVFGGYDMFHSLD